MNKFAHRFTIICLFALALFIAACRRSAETAVPSEVTFADPMEEILGGVRLEPVEAQWDGYGEAVDVFNDVLVVGASEWNQCGDGSVYVYRSRDGEWLEEAQLIASDQEEFAQQARQFEGQRFGTAVSVGEGIIAVGAPGNVLPEAGGHSGAVYLYEYSSQLWRETTKLAPDALEPDLAQPSPDPSACTRLRPRTFGALLALDGGTLAVGGGADGLIYVYQRRENGWPEQASIQVPSIPERELYMTSMALYGDTLALSAFYVLPPKEEEPVMTGNVVVYIFELADETWQEKFRFSPEEEVDLLFFREIHMGATVALSGESSQANLLAVGLPGFPNWSDMQDYRDMFGTEPEQLPEFRTSNRQTGAVYLFEKRDDSWHQQVTLRPAGWETPPGPGSMSAIFQPAANDAQSGSDNGGAHDSVGFVETAVFPGHLFSERPEITFFGATVDLDGNQLAVTAGFANATYVFERSVSEWVYQFSVKPSQEKIELVEDWAQVVRISGHTLLLGTPSDFGNSAYAFSLPTAGNDK